MEFHITNVPFKTDKYEVTEELAKVFHSNEFQKLSKQIAEKTYAEESDPGPHRTDDRKLNFKVELIEGHSGVQTNGSGYLTVPDWKIGSKFMQLISRQKLIVKIHGRKLHFSPSRRKVQKGLIQVLQKVPFQDPSIERELDERLLQLDRQLRVNKLHFGVWSRRPEIKPATRGIFCSEWQREYTSIGNALIWIEYAHKLIRIQLGDSALDEIAFSVVIKFSSLRNIWIGYEFGQPFVGFDLLTPPILEREWFNRAKTGEVKEDSRKFRQRIGYLDAGHETVSPYAHHMLVTLYEDSYLEEFSRFCVIAGLRKPINVEIDMESHHYFSQKNLTQVGKWLKTMDWSVGFQVEALLRTGLLNTEQLLGTLRRPITDLYTDHPKLAGNILRRFVEVLQSSSTVSEKNHLLKTFQRVCADFIKNPRNSNISPGTFSCYHITFTPTRMTLEGPYVTQSNRVIRRYREYHDHFVRVDFRDEDRLQYRWDREVDGTTFLQERVGKILKEGFILATLFFEFLAYSFSGLRDHSVWFVNPFYHSTEGLVDAKRIRQTLGDFSNVLKCPSKFAARLAQAFTATVPSVTISRSQWEEIPDMGPKNYEYTDGVCTISRELGDRIWAQLCLDRPDRRRGIVIPSAYQIRFLGYKGMVGIDDQLEGRKMCLRPSMNKFGSPTVSEANIEIALAFEKPMPMYLNRGLVMILEDRGVHSESFTNLQEVAVADAYTAYDSLPRFITLLKAHGLSNAYGTWRTMQRLNTLGLDFRHPDKSKRLESTFLRSIVHYSVNTILRDIKYRARILVPDSYKLVGLTDEGPAYVARGYENVFTLDDGEVFVCVQADESSQPRYLSGKYIVSRSPTVHPGDVQSVYAIGKPPDDKLCLFRNLKNVIVFPSVGHRSLPSCLAGGDLDGDLYDVCGYPTLFPTLITEAKLYPPVAKREIDESIYTDKYGKKDQEKVIPYVCDFVVEYINSDVLGLLSDNHLIRADQSSEGVFDPGCLTLATLCSQAVDYPKNGVPVDIHDAPRRLIPYKPNWKEGEETGARRTDFYESTRALGILYRAVHVDNLNPEVNASLTPGVFVNSITSVLEPFVNNYISKEPDDDDDDIRLLFQRYRHELNYITVTHTLSNQPDVRLSEEEVVVGTIIAQCSQNRWRKERIERLKLHSSTLVSEIRSTLLPHARSSPLLDKDARDSLRKAWNAWNFAAKELAWSQEGCFGYNSFGLIALNVILDCLDALNAYVM